MTVATSAEGHYRMKTEMSNEAIDDVVFITRGGDTYHTSIDCSTLNSAAYVEEIDRYELPEDRSICKMCSDTHIVSSGLGRMLEDLDPEEVG
ncbi:hypothetical protein ACFQDG_00885 [Natronoarchaeum mannanilyticum]|uniref:Uncharacterized protein n=1 Tax=Natronoarchaeum mannanilyticum TaxID=926360 RepID=A0AAV3TE40_9EURY